MPGMRPTAFWLLLALVLALQACSDGEGTAGTGMAAGSAGDLRPLPAVIESFEVGRGVFVRSLAVDQARASLWVGTSVGVLEVDLDTRKLRNTFTRKDGLANEYVFAIGIDPRGYKWFGTNAGGVSRYKAGQWKTFFPMHGLADFWVYSFANQGDGRLWIGTWAGVSLYDPRSETFTTYVDELVNEWVYGIAVDSRDRVWFGTEGGLSMFDGRAWHAWTHADGLGAENARGLSPSTNTGLGTRSRHDLGVLRGGEATYNPNYVFATLVARDDSVWLGTWGGGVSRFDGQRFTNLTTADGLANNIVYSLAQDGEGVFWFGTASGVSRYDGASWHTYGRAEGLLDEHVYALAVAANGDVWVATKGGVVRIGRPEAE